MNAHSKKQFNICAAIHQPLQSHFTPLVEHLIEKVPVKDLDISLSKMMYLNPNDSVN